MKSSIKNIISLLLFLFICSVVQATSVDAMEYSELKNYSVQELIDLGDHYYFSSGKGKMDSAAVCFSIIANRQGLKHMSNNENRLCIKVLNRLGYLYQYIYFDYQSSYGYYLQARDLAKQTGIKEDLPYTLRDIASLLLLNGKENNTNKSKAFNLFLESFYTSLEVRDYWAATTSFIKMMQLTRDKKEAFKKIHKEASILANLPKKPSFPHYQYALCMYNGLH